MGLNDGSDGRWRSVWQLYWWPFRQLWTDFGEARARRRQKNKAAP